jgi:hypothetical protein
MADVHIGELDAISLPFTDEGTTYLGVEYVLGSGKLTITQAKTIFQAYSSILTDTTASFTTADETKLDNIQEYADVTTLATVNAVLATALGTVTVGTWNAAIIAHEYGGLEANVSAYNGLVKISGGVTSAVSISSAGESLVGAADVSAMRTVLGVDATGTDNSTNVTIAGTPDYLTIAGQTITLGQIDVTTDITGIVPIANLATGTPDGTKFVKDDGTLAVPAGGGDVAASGTPVDGQISVWTSASAIEGDAALTFDTTTDTLAVGGAIELGHATDTTLARSGAGVVTIEGVEVTTNSGTQTLTNKTISDASNTFSIQGTTIKSTGESGGTKFLMEDGDGTCSWQVPAGAGDMAVAVYDTDDGVAEQLVGKTANQTLTNKTLSSPIINAPVLTLSTSASPAPTTEGQVLWDSDDDKLAIGDGAGTKTFVDETLVVLNSDIVAAEGFVRKTGAGTYEAIKSNLSASVAPTINEDSGDGYGIGSLWIDTTAAQLYVCEDATVGAANWLNPTAGVANLGINRTASTVVVTSSSGADATVLAADTNNAGIFTAAMFDKLENIAPGAQVNPTDVEIEGAYSNIVPQATTAEKLAGTESALRTYSPDDIQDMVRNHVTGGAGFFPVDVAAYGAVYGTGGVGTTNNTAVNAAILASYQASGYRGAYVIISDYLLLNDTIENTVTDGGTYRIPLIIDGLSTGHAHMASGESGNALFELVPPASYGTHSQQPDDIPFYVGGGGHPLEFVIKNLIVTSDDGDCIYSNTGWRHSRMRLENVMIQTTTEGGRGLVVSGAYDGMFRNVRFIDCRKTAIYVSSSTNLHFDDINVVGTGAVRRLNSTAGGIDSVTLDDSASANTDEYADMWIETDGERQYIDSYNGTTKVATIRGNWTGTDGADLVTNGDFATDTDWTKGGAPDAWTIGSGVATKTAGTAGNLSQDVSAAASTKYRVAFSLTRSAGNLTVSLGGVTHSTTFSANASVEIYITTTGTGDLTFIADSAFAGTIDNVVVKEMTGPTPGVFHLFRARTDEPAIYMGISGSKITNLHCEASAGPHLHVAGSGNSFTGWFESGDKSCDHYYDSTIPSIRNGGRYNTFDRLNHGSGATAFTIQNSPIYHDDPQYVSTVRFDREQMANLDLRQLAAWDQNDGTTSGKAYWSLEELFGEGGTTDIGQLNYALTAGATSQALFYNGGGIHHGPCIDITNIAGDYDTVRRIYPFDNAAGFDGHVVPAGAMVYARVRFSTDAHAWFLSRRRLLRNHVVKLLFVDDGVPAYSFRKWGHAYCAGVHEIVAIGIAASGTTIAANHLYLEACHDQGDAAAWVTSTDYSVGDLISNGGNIYKCMSNGVSGATAPTGTAAAPVSDDNLWWNYQSADSPGVNITIHSCEFAVGYET